MCQVTRVTLQALTTFRERHALLLPPLASPAPSLWARSMFVQCLPELGAMLHTAWTEGHHLYIAIIHTSGVRPTTTSHHPSRHKVNPPHGPRSRRVSLPRSRFGSLFAQHHPTTFSAGASNDRPIRDSPTEVPTSDVYPPVIQYAQLLEQKRIIHRTTCRALSRGPSAGTSPVWGSAIANQASAGPAGTGPSQLSQQEADSHKQDRARRCHNTIAPERCPVQQAPKRVSRSTDYTLSAPAPA